MTDLIHEPTALQKAARDLIDRWDSPHWKENEPTAQLISVLRDRLDTEVTYENAWRTLAMQFDRHRMSALWHLRAMLDDPEKHRSIAERFLKEPLS